MEVVKDRGDVITVACGGQLADSGVLDVLREP